MKRILLFYLNNFHLIKGKILFVNQKLNFSAAIHIPYYTAYQAIFHATKPQKNEIVFIHGCSGAVGLASLQFLKAKGIKVVGSAGSKEGLELIKSHGVDFSVNHHEPNYMQSVLDYTDKKGVDVILEMLANVNLTKDLKNLAIGGRIAIIGSRGPIEIDPRELMSKRSSIIGINLSLATEEEIEEIRQQVDFSLTSNLINPIVYLTMTLDKIAESHCLQIEPHNGALGKIVVHPW